ncbi:protein of unknown function [Modicisalibacter ilicicola DSM 19980]|uniref:DUF4174 domain-containing protein n=1 Tax=Modicisalibacter ilicicola DSM 19980 TaxID=1121942 RepID=A0A1M4UAG4_9GAMM|nr:DUF4174 domain-containing protein [Halomonas ilicicola]SHE53861.1 protein of unknown function [Halomonas ilicicola DSM 19980]
MARHLIPRVLMATLLALGVLMENAHATDDPANPLVTDRGMFRPLILVTPSIDNADYMRMREALQKHREEFDDRRMVLYSIEGGNGHRAGRPMTRFETRALLEALEVDPQGPMQVILVGFDGGKKMQLEGYVDPRQVFDIIDKMPIRRSEQRESTQRESRR